MKVTKPIIRLNERSEENKNSLKAKAEENEIWSLNFASTLNTVGPLREITCCNGETNFCRIKNVIVNTIFRIFSYKEITSMQQGIKLWANQPRPLSERCSHTNNSYDSIPEEFEEEGWEMVDETEFEDML